MGWEQLAGPPIFLTGSGRSGTTWVMNIFGAHPQVGLMRESALFSTYLGVSGLFSAHHYPERDVGMGQVVPRGEMVEFVRTTAIRFYQRVLRPEHRFFVDKSPQHSSTIPLIHELFPEARFVVIIRDGRDVAVSARAAARGWGRNQFKAYSGSVGVAATQWQRHVSASLDAAERFPDHVLVVRYEEMRHDPFGHYRRLFDFCGMPYDEALLEEIHARTDFATNYVPDENAFRRGGRIGDWYSDFSLIDALVFNVRAGRLLVRLGYAPSRLWLPNPMRQPALLLGQALQLVRRS